MPIFRTTVPIFRNVNERNATAINQYQYRSSYIHVESSEGVYERHLTATMQVQSFHRIRVF